MVVEIPRGVEVLIKKAAVDPKFKKLLLEKRAGAAEAIALKLEPAEAAMLEAVPAKQLNAIVANTKVNPSLRPAFLGYAAAVMLAALGATTVGCSGITDATFGNRPDPPEPPHGTAEPADGWAGQDASANGVKRTIEKSSLIKKDNPQT